MPLLDSFFPRLGHVRRGSLSYFRRLIDIRRHGKEKLFSKWEWIAAQCLANGWYESANVAYKIYDVLYGIYGTGSTAESIDLARLEETFAKTPMDLRPCGRNPIVEFEIYEVVCDVNLCIACQHSFDSTVQRVGCISCLFGKKAGRCIAGDSLFNTFYETFKKEC